MLWRSQLANVYHVCFRCGTRNPLSQMSWQNGLLLCRTNDCVDRGTNAILGSRDIKVARAMGEDRHELWPDPKLVAPVDRRNDQLEVLF